MPSQGRRKEDSFRILPILRKRIGNGRNDSLLSARPWAFVFTKIAQEREDPILAVIEGALFSSIVWAHSGYAHVLSRISIRIGEIDCTYKRDRFGPNDRAVPELNFIRVHLREAHALLPTWSP